MSDKRIDRDSEDWKDGYEEGYSEKDKGLIEKVAESLDPFGDSLDSEDTKVGNKEGQEDRDRNDLQNFKNEVRKDNE
ncbi:MAG: hypothetical protein JWQ40_5070 [Segetibacter sp.]|jgi:hypothetical protein|nr:hypothetical protein [Segetibacter sp.]